MADLEYGKIRVYDDRVALPPDFPSVKPSIGDSPAYEELVTRYTEEQAARRDGEGKYARREDSLMAPDCLIDEAKLSLLHAPPGSVSRFASIHTPSSGADVPD